MRRFLFLTFLVITTGVLNAQTDKFKFLSDTTYSKKVKEIPTLFTAPADSVFGFKSNSLMATGMVLGNNISVWAFDRFALNADYARINFKTMGNNIQNGFVWDNDLFSTNLIAHPYHGNLYFTSARSNGIGFWRSIPYTAAGSMMWEYLMENKQPSINDFIATTIGGVGLGEMLFRLSDGLVDDRTTGVERTFREVGLFVLSPMRGITRLINGDITHRRSVRGNHLPDNQIVMSIAGGYRFLGERIQGRTNIGNMFCFDMSFVYGTPFESVTNQPYDFFVFNMSGSVSSEQPIIGRINLLGQIAAHEIYLSSPRQNLTLGLFQHFNYYRIESNTKRHTMPFKLSEAASIGVGLLYKHELRKKSDLYIASHLSAIILGGSQTDYYRFDNRDYNLGSGFSLKIHGVWRFKDRLQVGFEFEDYRLFSLSGNDPDSPDDFRPEVMGDVSRSSLSVVNGNINYRITDRLFVAAESSAHFRKSNYKFFPSVIHQITGQRISIGAFF